MKILLVDDEIHVREVLHDFLTDIGATVLVAEHGAAALQLLESDAELDIMVTDILMPGIRGDELADRAVVLRPDLKVVLISGYCEPAHMKWPFLRKPFRMKELALQIAFAMD